MAADRPCPWISEEMPGYVLYLTRLKELSVFPDFVRNVLIQPLESHL